MIIACLRDQLDLFRRFANWKTIEICNAPFAEEKKRSFEIVIRKSHSKVHMEANAVRSANCLEMCVHDNYQGHIKLTHMLFINGETKKENHCNGILHWRQSSMQYRRIEMKPYLCKVRTA